MTDSLLLEVRDVSASFDARSGDSLSLSLDERIRHLPGRRSVHRARLSDGSIVLSKWYTHPKKGETDAFEEWKALQRLDESGLPVPQPLALGVDDAGGWVVLTAFLKDAISLGEALRKSEQALLATRLAKLISLVHQTHECRVIQTDLHLENYLIDDREKLWVIDAGSHRFFPKGLPEQQRVDNWALLRANLLLGRQRDTFDAVFAESNAHRWGVGMKVRSPGVLDRRLRRYRAKCLRTCSEFVRLDGGERVCLRRREFAPDWLDTLMGQGIDQLEAEYTVLKRASRCLVVGGESPEGLRWVLKSHWHRGFRQVGRMSRARRSWIAGCALGLLGIPTPTPLAFWEFRQGGRLIRDGLLMAFDDGTPLQRWVREDHDQGVRRRTKREARSFLDVLGELHASHGDTKASNFHVGADGELRVIDLDGFQWGGPLWKRRHAKDRERFRRNAVKFPEGEDVFLAVE